MEHFPYGILYYTQKERPQIHRKILSWWMPMEKLRGKSKLCPNLVIYILIQQDKKREILAILYFYCNLQYSFLLKMIVASFMQIITGVPSLVSIAISLLSIRIMYNFVFLKIISTSGQKKIQRKPSANYCNYHLHLQRVQQEYVLQQLLQNYA